MKKISYSTLIIGILTIVSAVIHIAFVLCQSFADFFDTTVGHISRLILSKITGVFPFSIAELLLLSSPFLVIILIISVNKKGGTPLKRILSAGKILLSVMAVIYVLFVLTFAAGYSSSTLDTRLGINKKAVSANELYDTLVYVIDNLNKEAENITFEDGGASYLPYNYNDLSQKICFSYEKVYNEYNLGESFNSKAKTLIISPVMTYTHISGVYSFFTGEANINTNYPDYVCAFSAAHELAHQRGIAREDEANFMAYLICIESEDDYLRYSGYLSMFSYISSALLKADRELYTEAVASLTDNARGELRAYSKFFDKYRDNVASTVSDAVNDTYLKVQGTEGIKSYGMVVDLAVAFHKNNT